MFSGAISLKCRHLRSDYKYRNGGSTVRKDKQKQKQNKNKNHGRNQQEPEVSNEVLIEDMDEDKENTDDII